MVMERDRGGWIDMHIYVHDIYTNYRGNGMECPPRSGFINATKNILLFAVFNNNMITSISIISISIIVITIIPRSHFGLGVQL